jgi:YD repeat-containing protein
LKFDCYDSKGNVLTTTQDGFSTAYIWGYNRTFPVAKVINAIHNDTGVGQTFNRVNQVLHENFEEHPQRITSLTAHTGKHYYLGSYDVELRDKIVGNYTLVYWSSSDGITWVKNEAAATIGVSSTFLTIGNSSTYIDDIQLHPVGAQMSTYTYDPLLGMTSQTDPAGVITYYEYDAFGRLSVIRDHNRNLLKQMKYKYKN